MRRLKDKPKLTARGSAHLTQGGGEAMGCAVPQVRNWVSALVQSPLFHTLTYAVPWHSWTYTKGKCGF